MEDLLKEEDFLYKKSDYNPWKYFRLFYGVAAIHCIVSFLIIGSYSDNVPLTLVLAASPCIMAFIMTFVNKRIVDVHLKTLLIAVLLLLTVYYVLVILAFLIAGASLPEIGITTLVFIGYFIFCSIIIGPVVKIKQKHRKYII